MLRRAAGGGGEADFSQRGDHRGVIFSKGCKAPCARRVLFSSACAQCGAWLLVGTLLVG